MLQRYIIKKFLKSLENIQYGTLELVTPDHKTYYFHGSDDIKASLHILDWSMLSRLIVKGDVGFAESYRDGLFNTNDIVDLLTMAIKNAHMLDQYVYGNSLSHIASQFIYYLQSNTIKGSKRNIHAHYDLGNEFYALWLDSTMTYSSAIFKNNEDTLLQAQHHKHDRIIEKFNQPSGSLLEIGCGWGSFADRVIDKCDIDMTAITISDAQYKFAKQRLDNKVNISLQDYRHHTGKYDNIVSIEMFEAVGEKFWPIYFKKLNALLKDKGKAIIQTITIDNKHFDRYRKTSDVIRTLIFPGGMLPSIERFEQEARKANLQTIDVFKFGKDYARTLQHWLNNFDNNLSNIKAMGFDDEFIRIWRFYLGVCIAGFTEGRINVVQTELINA